MTTQLYVCIAVVAVLALLLWHCSKKNKEECDACKAPKKQNFNVEDVRNPLALDVENDVRVTDSLMGYRPVSAAQFTAGDSLMGLGVPLGANETINVNSDNHYGNFNTQFQPMSAAYGNNSRATLPIFSRQKTGLIGIFN